LGHQTLKGLKGISLTLDLTHSFDMVSIQFIWIELNATTVWVIWVVWVVCAVWVVFVLFVLLIACGHPKLPLSGFCFLLCPSAHFTYPCLSINYAFLRLIFSQQMGMESNRQFVKASSWLISHAHR